MDFKVRRAERGDVDRIAPLFDSYRQFYGKRPDPRRAASFLRERVEAGESVIFLAEDLDQADEALGFVQLFPSFSSVAACRIWVLNDLFVAPQARGRGVGRALMECAREHAVRTGAKRLTLETTEENRVARALYEDLGYVRVPESIWFYALELDDTE